MDDFLKRARNRIVKSSAQTVVIGLSHVSTMDNLILGTRPLPHLIESPCLCGFK